MLRAAATARRRHSAIYAVSDEPASFGLWLHVSDAATLNHPADDEEDGERREAGAGRHCPARPVLPGGGAAPAPVAAPLEHLAVGEALAGAGVILVEGRGAKHRVFAAFGALRVVEHLNDAHRRRPLARENSLGLGDGGLPVVEDRFGAPGAVDAQLRLEGYELHVSLTRRRARPTGSLLERKTNPWQGRRDIWFFLCMFNN